MSKEHPQHTTAEHLPQGNRWCALDPAEHPPSKRELGVNHDKERFFLPHRYPGGGA